MDDQVSIEVGQVWRGREHGSLFKVVAADDTNVWALVMYAGNPYYADTVGTIQKLWREVTRNGQLEHAPEWESPLEAKPGQ